MNLVWGIENFFPRGEALIASLKLIPHHSPSPMSRMQGTFLKTCSMLKHWSIVFCMLIA